MKNIILSVCKEENQKCYNKVSCITRPAYYLKLFAFELNTWQNGYRSQIPSNHSSKMSIHVDIRAERKQNREKNQKSYSAANIRPELTILSKSLPVDSHVGKVGSDDSKDKPRGSCADGCGFVTQD